MTPGALVRAAPPPRQRKPTPTPLPPASSTSLPPSPPLPPSTHPPPLAAARRCTPAAYFRASPPHTSRHCLGSILASASACLPAGSAHRRLSKALPCLVLVPLFVGEQGSLPLRARPELPPAGRAVPPGLARALTGSVPPELAARPWPREEQQVAGARVHMRLRARE